MVNNAGKTFEFIIRKNKYDLKLRVLHLLLWLLAASQSIFSRVNINYMYEAKNIYKRFQMIFLQKIDHKISKLPDQYKFSADSRIIN